MGSFYSYINILDSKENNIYKRRGEGAPTNCQMHAKKKKQHKTLAVYF